MPKVESASNLVVAALIKLGPLVTATGYRKVTVPEVLQLALQEDDDMARW